ncbi:MAG: hypothetical protein PHN31_01550 [Candidatus Gracilibacteria bacterium]|nr:hypothetical protein [Candidatus Gracilibacteria bacterium]
MQNQNNENLYENQNKVLESNSIDKFDLREFDMQKIINTINNKKIDLNRGEDQLFISRFERLIKKRDDVSGLVGLENALKKIQDLKNAGNGNSLKLDDLEKETKGNLSNLSVNKNENTNSSIESYNSKKVYHESELLGKFVDFGKSVESKLPQNFKSFLDSYYTESLMYSGDKKELKVQSDSGGILNVWSHKYAAQMIAVSVFDGLPKSMGELQRYIIATMAATSALYLKETQDQNITPQDIMVPFFYDFGDGNLVYFTYGIKGSLNVDFKLSNIKALSEKAGGFLRYIEGGITNNPQTTKKIKDEMRVNVGFGINDAGDVRVTSRKNNLDKAGNYVTIGTYMDEIYNAKLGGNGDGSLKGRIGAQNHGKKTKAIAGSRFDTKHSLNNGDVSTSVGVVTDGKNTGTMIGGGYSMKDNGPSVDYTHSDGYLDEKSNVYGKYDKISGEIPVAGVRLGGEVIKGKLSNDGEKYSKPGTVLGGTMSFDTKGSSIPVYSDIRDGLGGTDLNLGVNVGTNNTYSVTGGIEKKVGDTQYGASISHGKGLETSGEYISGNISKDIIKMFDVFKTNGVSDKNKVKIMQELGIKYNLPITKEDIVTLGPINSLKLFALANKDLVDKELFLSLGFSFNGGKIVLPKNIIDLKDKNNVDFLGNTIIKMSVGGRLGPKLSLDKDKDNLGIGTDIFTKLDILISENTAIEYLLYCDWTKVINRLSYVQNIKKDKNGNVLGFVLNVENQNGVSGAGVGINNIEKSGKGDRFTIKILQTGGISISWGTKSLVFGDKESETSLNFGTLLPIISTVITENLGQNVTNESGETFASYENVFQSVVKTKKDRDIVKNIVPKLNSVGQKVGLEFDKNLISKLDKTENLKYFDDWLNLNAEFIEKNAEKIRYFKLGYSSDNSSKFDDSTKIFEYSLSFGNEITKLTDANLVSKNYDFYLFTDSPKELSKKIKESNKSLINYVNSLGIDESKILIECFKNIEVIGFDRLDQNEKKGFIKFIIREIKVGNIDELRFKRISIEEDSFFSSSVSINSGVKTLSLEKKIFKNLGETENIYKLSELSSLDKFGDSVKEVSGLINSFSSKNRKALVGLFDDIYNFKIIGNEDDLLKNSETSDGETQFTDYYGNNGELYISKSYYESILKGKVSIKNVAKMLRNSGIDYMGDIDNEIREKFLNNEAKIIKISRESGKNTFYEFRPTTDIENKNGLLKVSYDVFDNGNSKINGFDLSINLNNSQIFVNVDGKKYEISDLEFQDKYNHIFYAITGMKGGDPYGDIKALGGILEMMFK